MCSGHDYHDALHTSAHTFCVLATHARAHTDTVHHTSTVTHDNSDTARSLLHLWQHNSRKHAPFWQHKSTQARSVPVEDNDLLHISQLHSALQRRSGLIEQKEAILASIYHLTRKRDTLNTLRR